MNTYCQKLLKNRPTKEDIDNNNKIVYQYLFKKFGNFNSLSNKIVEETFYIIDKIYFDNNINKFIKKSGSSLKFNASNKLSSTAGLCKYKYYLDEYDRVEYGKYEIVISKKIIDSLFQNKKIKSLKINGLLCKDKLECYINLYQHEITHLLIAIFCHREGEGMGGHTQMFKALVYALFGHTKYKHWLLAGDGSKLEEDELYNKTNVEIGDFIITKKYKNKKYEGKVTKLGPKYVVIKLKNDKLFKICYSFIYKIKKQSGRKLIKTKKEEPEDIKKKLKIGDEIYIKIKDKIKKGKIISLNKSRASVLIDEQKWYIPYRMIITN